MHPLRATLIPFSLAFAAAAVLRANLYSRGIIRSHRLTRPVISIGNLTVGGSGKTPMVECIAALLSQRGFPVSILSRGYRGRYRGSHQIVCQGGGPIVTSELCGDEPYLLAKNLPSASIIVGADRALCGRIAEGLCPGCIHILDDGYQHLRLKRDLNILLLDATEPSNQEYLLPAGRLREPFSALRRADLICVTRTRPDTNRELLLSRVRKYRAEVPLLFTEHRTEGVLLSGEDKLQPPSTLQGVPLFAFAGIAKPEAFFRQLPPLGYDIRGQRIFPDHYRYRPSDWSDLQREARKRGAIALVTTQKDQVKLPAPSSGDLPLWYVKIHISIEDRQPLLRLLQEKIWP